MSENASEGTEQMDLPATTSVKMNLSGGSPGDQPLTETPNTDATEQILPSIPKPRSNRSSTINNDQQPPSHHSPTPTVINRSAADNPRAPSNFGHPSRFPDYKCYPADEASPGKHQMPETNREAVMMALRNLQEKIFQLEKEKNEALSHLHDLGRETSERTAKTSPFNKINTSSDLTNLNDISELSSKLTNAESRCMSLDKYLNDLKQSFENYFGLSFEVSSSSGAPQLRNNRQSQAGVRKDPNLNVEKERLRTMKEGVERKIKELEALLQHERRNRQIIEDKSSELERTTFLSPMKPRTLFQQSTPIAGVPVNKKFNTMHLSESTTLPTQSTLPPQSTLPTQSTLPPQSTLPTQSLPTPTAPVQSLSDSSFELECLLSQLQEEFSHFERHREEMQHMMLTSSSSDFQNSILRELEDIKLKMQVKADQISKVAKLQKQMEHLRELREGKSHSNGGVGNTWDSAQASSKSATIPLCDDDRRVQVLTTITACGRAMICSHCQEHL